MFPQTCPRSRAAHGQNWARTDSCSRRGGWADTARPKNGDVKVPTYVLSLTRLSTLKAAATIALVSFQAASGQTPFTPVGTIYLPGVVVRIVHLAVDTSTHRLYVSDFGNRPVDVIDL